MGKSDGRDDYEVQRPIPVGSSADRWSRTIQRAFPWNPATKATENEMTRSNRRGIVDDGHDHWLGRNPAALEA